MKKCIFIVCFFSTIVLETFSQYYVSVNGSDSNSGSLTQPFKTIQRAANVMNPGDVCYIMAGVYRENVRPSNNGTVSNHIIFRNYQNDIVTIYGTDSIRGWQPYLNGIYKAYAPDSVLQVLVDTTIANEATYPNIGKNRLSTNRWNGVTITVTGDATLSGTNFPPNYWVGGYFVNLVASKWIAHNGIINSSNGNSITCTQRSNPWDNTTGNVYIGNGKGYITHHLHALDTIDEWHWQNDTLYYFPKNPATINTNKIEARTRMYGFDCEGKNYIEIQNLNFVCSSVNFENSVGCILKKSNILYPVPFFYYSRSWDRQNTLSTNISLSTFTGKGVAMSGSNNLIKQCYIAHSWGDGITIGGQNNTVDSCLIEDCNWSATDDAPLTSIGRGHTITHNIARNAARGILIHRMTSRATISYNNFYDGGIVNADLGITYSYRTHGDSTVISYNWIHDNHATGTVPGIYLDNFDTAYIVHHNVVWNCFGAMRTNLAAVDHQIYNNTLWGNFWSIMTSTNSILVNQKVKNNLSNQIFANNIYTIQSNNLTTFSPGFTNLTQNDYTLTASSSAINYGVHIPGITDGYIGSSPDAGAYEYGAAPWIPGTNVQPISFSDLLTPNNTSINNYSTSNLTIFPNPTKGIIHINYDTIEISKIDIYNVHGQKITSYNKSNQIDLSTYSKGLYFVVINDLNKKTTHTELIILE